MSDSSLVSVVMLSYNRPRHLERALSSLRAQASPRLDVIVVDNRSETSDEIASVVARFPEVRLIAHARNLGFTGGMNSGIAAALGEYVYLTEDDIEVEPDCIRALVTYLEAHAEVGVVGPIMLNRDSGTVRCAGGHFSLGGTYRMTILGAGEPPARGAGGPPYDVMYLPGSMLMARASLFRDLAGFRDDFFMYVEDVEFCTRVLKLGLSIVVVPQARVVHAEPEPGVSSRIEFHKIKNLSALYLVHAPLGVLPTFVLRYGALGALRAFADGRLFVHLRAWAWTLAHARRLLAERPRWRSSTARVAAAAL